MQAAVQERGVELDLKAQAVSSHKLEAAYHYFFALLDSLTDSITDTPDAADWQVKNPESMVWLASPKPNKAPRETVDDLPRQIVSELNLLHSAPLRTRHLSREDWGYYSKLGHLVEASNGLRALEIRADSLVHRIDQTAFEALPKPAIETELRSREPRLIWGSVTGTLETISIHRNNVCTVYAPLSPRGVRCYFNGPLPPEIAGSIGSRVHLEGELALDKDGFPMRLNVVLEPRVISVDERLPRPAELAGIFRGMDEVG